MLIREIMRSVCPARAIPPTGTGAACPRTDCPVLRTRWRWTDILHRANEDVSVRSPIWMAVTGELVL
jgi:hypothetical protein